MPLESAKPSLQIDVVDDDEAVRGAVRRLLQSLGYRVRTFESAETFLADASPADGLILDVRLPGMSGIDLLERLAASGTVVGAVFITAYPARRERERALAAGAVDYLEKPFEKEQLLDAVQKAVRVHQSDG